MKFKGIYTALATPFDNDGKVNLEALENLIDYNLKMKPSGFFVGGSSAEAFLQSIDERKLVLKKVKEYVGDKLPLIAHIGCISTEDAKKLAKYAEELGYDAISSVAPFYHNFTFAEIKKYFFDLADSVNIPLFIYNIPAFTGVTFTFEQLSELFQNEKITGIKHTSGDYYLLRRLKTAFPEKTVFNGYDETFLAGLAMGADGGVGGHFNYMADKFVEIYNLFCEGEITEAMACQEKATKIIDIVCEYGLLLSIKSILKAKGVDCGNCREPFKALTSEEEKALLDAVLPLL